MISREHERKLINLPDIELLHVIVLRAQDSNTIGTRPKTALYRAYEDVFREKGLNPNQDRACLRFLFHLADHDPPPNELHLQLERLLAKRGIVLETASDGEGSVVVDEELAQNEEGEDAELPDITAAWPASPRRTGRRKSFTSMYDVTAEVERRIKKRDISQASDSRAPPMSPFRRRTETAPLETDKKKDRRASEGEDSSSAPGQDTFDPRLSVRDLPIPVRRNLGSLARQTRSSQNHRYENPQDEEGFSKASQYSDGSETHLPALSRTQVAREVEAFDQVRDSLWAKKYFRKWFIIAQERNERRIERLEIQAVIQDRRSLMQLALHEWRAKLDDKWEEDAAQHRLMILNKQAVSEYDDYLKRKAFNQWLVVATEARVRTEKDRQQYLRTKYFHAWRQLTVANEQLVRRQKLSTQLDMLRKKAAGYYSDELASLDYYYSQFARRIFYRWIYASAGIKAEKTWDRNLVTRMLSIWQGKAKHATELQRRAYIYHQQKILRKTMLPWMTKTRIDVAGDHQADAFRKQALLKRYASQWNIEAKLAPHEGRSRRMADWRIARSAFGIWLLRTRMIFRADAVCLQRERQNAFTAWNDRLREKAVQDGINDRLIVQALYKWVIAQRAALIARVREDRVKRTVFRRLIESFRAHQTRLTLAEGQVMRGIADRLTSSTLECWKLQMDLTGARNQMADDFYSPKVQYDALALWRDRHEHMQEMETWAKHASFYFLMTKSLQRWKQAFAEARKKRLNDAYKKVRKAVKVRLARKVLGRWCERYQQVASLEQQGQMIAAQQDANLVRNSLLHWRHQYLQRRQAIVDADGKRNEQVMRQTLQFWINASKQVISLQTRADQYYHIRISELCSAHLRKLSMKAFECRRRLRDAEAMQERHWNKHFRNIFRHWTSKTREASLHALMQNVSPSTEQETTDAGYGTASQEGPPSVADKGPGTTQRAEEWTAFDADLLPSDDWMQQGDELPQATFTPMQTPGYLNTPSKRAARARAMAQISTTPAGPVPTPFATRLRAGMATPASQGVMTTARKDRIGRSALGDNVRNVFDDPGGV